MYTVGDYLLDRLNELGVDDVFGVPGDYNLKFLDNVISHPALKWIGNANELNAAYAADGYARTKGMAALITTFGVGELSAINGIAGSYAESVPVLHIVGAPTTAVQDGHKLVHHTLGDGVFTHFYNIYKNVTVSAVCLTGENPTEHIDKVLKDIYFNKRPGYLCLPVDVAELEAEKPVSPLNMKAAGEDKKAQVLASALASLLATAKNPVILAGHEIVSFSQQNMLANFSTKTNIPVAVLPLGKGAIDEEHHNYIGVYSGSTSEPSLKARVDNADLIIGLGIKLTDSATSGFSQGFSNDNLFLINSDTSSVLGSERSKTNVANFLNELDQFTISKFPDSIVNVKVVRKSTFTPSNNLLTQKKLWEAVEVFLEKGNTLVAEQGTSFFGAMDIPLKSGMRFIGQPLWGSIGFTFPAMLGSQIANPDSRHILFIGDGSLQLTIQAMGMALREKLTPIVVVINNDGYTVEREIHGKFQPYNDIPRWRYHQLPLVFGGNAQNVMIYQAKTEAEFYDAFGAAQKDTRRLQWIEVYMDKLDAPDLLKKLGVALEKQNS